MVKQIETTDAQNMVARIDRGIYLNINKPSPQIMKLYARVRKDIVSLHLSLDLLNDMKEELDK